MVGSTQPQRIRRSKFSLVLLIGFNCNSLLVDSFSSTTPSFFGHQESVDPWSILSTPLSTRTKIGRWNEQRRPVWLQHSTDRQSDEIDDTSARPPPPPLSKFLQAVFLIAGTTVGGGFLALPKTVVIPLGGFLPSAAALVLVWAYLLACSLILCDGILLAQARQQQQQQRDNKPSMANGPSSVTTTAIGIPKTAQIALGSLGSQSATLLLVSLTVATLVSQLSRAGSLLASQLSESTSQPALTVYRYGCALATMFGAAITHTRRRTEQTQSVDHHVTRSFRKERATSFADKCNSVLTVVFLGSAVLLFRAGAKAANWSACWSTSGESIVQLLPKALTASPIMLQLLVYGEILPNVCEMLEQNRPTIRRAVWVGSSIPLLLLTGWAALGVALIGNDAILRSSRMDPVDILMTTTGGSSAVPVRLLLLAMSAIGTTILGSFLALQSAYDDWQGMLPSTRRRFSAFMERPWVRTLVISLPPLAVSCISPSLFLQAIDFAGSYPVILLYGFLPPLIVRRLQDDEKFGKTKMNKLYAAVGVLSTCLVGMNFLSDGSDILRRLLFRQTS
ncbi:Tryptophan/tyrosine permease family [Seminavis robusta]|uniref:Tryptophan/tyrosine permease family n=1 Tax=Seminavis robusta TaxID=568900 RepID=A0A9N8ET66_9STRA|nr:Tryptophan/tyrosine permease family [Seminavis robusta]|eukprot:Sro1751_g295260.1 Tryptophan/tyrosine permease family (563) ;mRNA; r:2118-3806